MVIKSYAKINLLLKVNSKLKNGLHDIQSFFCLIDLSDKIQIKKNQKKKDQIKFVGPFSKFVKLKNNSVNILLKNLRDLRLISGHYSVTITKNIPILAGLGGGTSNAAFLIKYLLKKKASSNLLNRFEKIIGSDLKIFFKKQGFLQNLKKIKTFRKKQNFYFVLAQPKIKCSTKEIYSKVKKFSKKEKFNKNMVRKKNKFLDYLSKNRNDLQFIVERKYPQIKKLLKDIKNEKECCFSRMTGSGSVCYGLFNSQNNAKKAFINLKYKYPKIWFSLAKTV
ncbi:4-(cytidine 5'-diphospho)-2-C-methyl-D-erythritol kinase [Pelagibacteraceae bacterium]|nr:4-(cytidine 5'-diphospho)-2-C-methyl-D-erythritol kinase [Pelagibacteraceae bacterium]|tara:strand:- start:54 stop:890 length:837 start_codon:yes stop_codon:yes gene_type:complete